MTQRFEYTRGMSNKFWEVEIGPTLASGNCVLYVRWGRIGTKGSSVDHVFATPAICFMEMYKLIKEKTGKGYELVTNEVLSNAIMAVDVKVTPYYSFDLT